MSWRRWLLVVALVLVVAVVLTRFSPVPVSPREDLAGIIYPLVAALFVFALIVERALEVFLTVIRAPGSEELDRRIAELGGVGGSDGASPESELGKLIEKRAARRAQTRGYALCCGLAAGVVLSLVGLRALKTMVDPVELAMMKGAQRRVFDFLDVFFTGLLIAGGSDHIHKLMDALRLLFEKTSAMAKDRRDA